MHKSRDLCVNLYKIGCISAKQLSELIALRSICTIFAQNNGKNMIEGHIINEAESEKAVLVGLITPTQNEAKANEYLDELAFLADTAGAETVKKFLQRMDAQPRDICGKGQA